MEDSKYTMEYISKYTTEYNDKSKYTIEYTPSIKITCNSPLKAFNETKGYGIKYLDMLRSHPYVSKYRLPKDEYIVNIIAKCDAPMGNPNNSSNSSYYWLSLITNYGRMINTEKNTRTGRQYDSYVSYYTHKNKYCIHFVDYGNISNELEIIELTPLTYKLPTIFLNCLDVNTTEGWQVLNEEFHHSIGKWLEYKDLLLSSEDMLKTNENLRIQNKKLGEDFIHSLDKNNQEQSILNQRVLKLEQMLSIVMTDNQEKDIHIQEYIKDIQDKDKLVKGYIEKTTLYEKQLYELSKENEEYKHYIKVQIRLSQTNQ